MAYTTFYLLGLIMSMQVPFVGFQPIRTSEHMAAAGLCVLLCVFMCGAYVVCTGYLYGYPSFSTPLLLISPPSQLPSLSTLLPLNSPPSQLPILQVSLLS